MNVIRVITDGFARGERGKRERERKEGEERIRMRGIYRDGD